MKNRRWLIIPIIFFGVIACGLTWSMIEYFVFDVIIGDSFEPAKTNYAPEEAATVFGAVLPTDATDVHMIGLDYPQSRVAAARFQMPKNSETLQPFLTEIGFSDALEPGLQYHDNFWFIEGEDWWNPGEASAQIGGDFTENGTFWDVLVDQDHPDYDVVYLMKEVN